ncbi:MAG: alcohol dehydrogenase catalytic domain-containing protein [Candidatus Latescibacterota bacterium]
MHGLWLDRGELCLRTDLPDPEPAPGEALVRVLQAGICNTDLELVKGYYPYSGIPGHEFVGCVERGPGGLEGRRVVGEINAACGTCRTCRRGWPGHCPQRTVLGIVGRHGAFAEKLVLPAANLHAVPDTVTTDAATFVEPLAAALAVQQQVHVGPELRVLLIGDGKLGQVVAQTLRLTGCELCVVGRHAAKLSLLADRGIAVLAAQDLAEASFDLVVECTGNPEGLALARRLVRPRGTIVLKSTYAGRVVVDASALVVEEVTLVGSRCGPFPAALRLLEARLVDVEPLISARYRLEDGVAAFSHAEERGVLKVLLEMPA